MEQSDIAKWGRAVDCQCDPNWLPNRVQARTLNVTLSLPRSAEAGMIGRTVPNLLIWIILTLWLAIYREMT
jgi:hypothetical protein